MSRGAVVLVAVLAAACADGVAPDADGTSPATASFAPPAAALPSEVACDRAREALELGSADEQAEAFTELAAVAPTAALRDAFTATAEQAAAGTPAPTLDAC